MNDCSKTPCCCGSKRNYSECCFISPIENATQKREAIQEHCDKITNKINQYVEENLPEVMGNLSWQSLSCFIEHSNVDEDINIPEREKAFTFHQLFHWRDLPPLKNPQPLLNKENPVPAEYYFNRRPLDIHDRDLILAMLNTQYCFYQIIAVEPNHHCVLKNLLTEQHVVAMMDNDIISTQHINDMVYTSILEHQDMQVLLYTGCYIFPSEYQIHLINFKESSPMSWNKAKIHINQNNLLNIYLTLRAAWVCSKYVFTEEWLAQFENLSDETAQRDLTISTHTTKPEAQPETPADVCKIPHKVEYLYLYKWLNQKHTKLDNLTPLQARDKHRFTIRLKQLIDELEYTTIIHRKWIINKLNLD